jgi:hypothetical protein
MYLSTSRDGLSSRHDLEVEEVLFLNHVIRPPFGILEREKLRN